MEEETWRQDRYCRRDATGSVAGLTPKVAGSTPADGTKMEIDKDLKRDITRIVPSIIEEGIRVVVESYGLVSKRQLRKWKLLGRRRLRMY